MGHLYGDTQDRQAGRMGREQLKQTQTACSRQGGTPSMVWGGIKGWEPDAFLARNIAVCVSVYRPIQQQLPGLLGSRRRGAVPPL
jgi:hypothetical protein